MGWCSGTDIFDRVVGAVIFDYEAGLINLSGAKYIIICTIKAFEEHDWDCQQESMFYMHSIVKDCFKLIHPNWYTFETEG